MITNLKMKVKLVYGVSVTHAVNYMYYVVLGPFLKFKLTVET